MFKNGFGGERRKSKPKALGKLIKISRVGEALPASQIETPEDIVRAWDTLVCTMDWHDPDRESLIVFPCNTKLRLLGIHHASSGTNNETIAHPRDIFRPAIALNAYAIVVAHNHPSGDPSPSGADIEMTRRLRAASELLQISILDHVIIGRSDINGKGYYSFKEAGYL